MAARYREWTAPSRWWLDDTSVTYPGRSAKESILWDIIDLRNGHTWAKVSLNDNLRSFPSLTCYDITDISTNFSILSILFPTSIYSYTCIVSHTLHTQVFIYKWLFMHSWCQRKFPNKSPGIPRYQNLHWSFHHKSMPHPSKIHSLLVTMYPIVTPCNKNTGAIPIYVVN